MSAAAARDFEWWAAELEREGHEGVPLARCDGMAAADSGEAGVVYADASGGGGFAAWTCVGGEVLMVAGEWSEAERELNIAALELLASTFGAVALAPWLPRDVYSFTDNTVAMAAMRSLRATSPAMQAILARRTAWLHAEGRVEQPRRVTSAANLWADLGSRPEKGGVAAVEQQAAALGLGFRRVELPAAWRDTAGLLLAEPSWEGGGLG